MTVARVLRSAATATLPVHARILRSGATATSPVAVHARVLRSAATATVVPVVLAPTGRPVGPGEPVTVTATLQSGGSADSWTWRQVSGPSVTLTGSGPSRTITGPSLMPPGQAIVLGVRATTGGLQSAEATVTLTVLPQLEWTYTGAAWVGAVSVPA